MTISIVSQLTASSLAATTAGSRTDEAPSADLGAVVADFASLLAAFAVDTRSSQKPPEDQNQTDATAQILADAPPTPGLADALAVQAAGQAATPLRFVTLAAAIPTARIGVASALGEAATSGLPNEDPAPAGTIRLLAPLTDEAALRDAASAGSAADGRQTLLAAAATTEPRAAKLAAFSLAGAEPDSRQTATGESSSPPLGALLPMPNGAHPSPAPVDGHPAQHVATPLGHPAWTDDFAQKLLWFADNDRQQAQLTLNPAQLGQVEITLSIDREVTSAHFASANADVRSAIENSLPRLRELLAGAGVQLGQVTVGSESDRQPPTAREDASQSPRRRGDDAILGIASGTGQAAHTLAIRRGNALVDLFV